MIELDVSFDWLRQPFHCSWVGPGVKFSYASHKEAKEVRSSCLGHSWVLSGILNLYMFSVLCFCMLDVQLGIETIPALVGPVSYLLLSNPAKGVDKNFSLLSLLGKILPIYLTCNIKWLFVMLGHLIFQSNIKCHPPGKWWLVNWRQLVPLGLISLMSPHLRNWCSSVDSLFWSLFRAWIIPLWIECPHQDILCWCSIWGIQESHLLEGCNSDWIWFDPLWK